MALQEPAIVEGCKKTYACDFCVVVHGDNRDLSIGLEIGYSPSQPGQIKIDICGQRHYARDGCIDERYGTDEAREPSEVVTGRESIIEWLCMVWRQGTETGRQEGERFSTVRP
jgi:hypothetical protein